MTHHWNFWITVGHHMKQRSQQSAWPMLRSSPGMAKMVCYHIFDAVDNALIAQV
jgi:hypothetical protein